MDKSCVYWIHLPEQTDILTQGYVGVAKGGMQKRFREHQSATKRGSNLKIHNAMRKYGDKIIVETIVLAEITYCYDLERKLRPYNGIGYNTSVGGNSTNLGSKHSDEAKLRMSKAQKERVFSDEFKNRMKTLFKDHKHSSETILKMQAAAKIRGVSARTLAAAALHNKNLKPWQTSQANKKLWRDATKIFDLISRYPEYGQKKLATLIEYSPSQLLVIYKKIKAGWNPNKDTDWLIFSSELTPDASGDK